MWNAGLNTSQAGVKTARGNINNFRCTDNITLTAESEKELKSILMRVKEESGKAGLKFNIQKAKIMAPSPITSWQIDGEEVGRVAGFIFLGSKIIADNECNHEIKRCLPFGRKITANLDSVLKSRDTTLPTKFRMVKAMIFLVVMNSCESWTTKTAEWGRIDDFELRCSSISALLTVPKPLTVWITRNCGEFWKRWEYQTTWPASWEIWMQVRKQQLELDMEQQTGSK